MDCKLDVIWLKWYFRGNQSYFVYKHTRTYTETHTNGLVKIDSAFRNTIPRIDRL